MMPTLQETLRAVDDLFLQRSAEAERREPLPLRSQGPQGPHGELRDLKAMENPPIFIGKPR
jgi:hypothetical protein